MSRSRNIKLGLGVLAGAVGGFLLYKALSKKSSEDGEEAPRQTKMEKGGGPLDLWCGGEDAGAAPAPKPKEKSFMQYDGAGKKMLIFYGTEYGTSKTIAEKTAEILLKTQGIHPRVLSMTDFKLVDWSQEKVVLIICSTYGDGVPPTDARDFYDWLHGSDAPKLDHILFSVMAMGDSTYPLFCKCGRDLDKRFAELGAQRINNRSDSDMENWDVINRWMEKASAAAVKVELPELDSDYLADRVAAAAPAVGFNKSKPFLSTLLVKRLLTKMSGKDDKETFHFELDLTGSDLKYVPGDALGVYAHNAPESVDQVLKAFGVDGNKSADYPTWHYKTDAQKEKPTLRDVLAECYDLKNVKPEMLKLLLTNAKDEKEKDRLNSLLAQGSAVSVNKTLSEYLYGREIVDVLTEFRARPSLDLFLSQLGRLLPRYYSISSSQNTDVNRVSVTVAAVRYETFSRARIGVCSTFLGDRMQIGSKVAVFINLNHDFRLPADINTPTIMVGPGTGLAPFRSFLQERVFQKATGPAMLLFGCRSAKQDYLYSDELENYREKHGLTLVNAFSRDQPQKIYVQHRLLEQKQQVWEMLQAGGHFYVCGDAAQMAGDVHKALLHIACELGEMSEEDAETYVKKLEADRRYQKDVWF